MFLRFLKMLVLLFLIGSCSGMELVPPANKSEKRDYLKENILNGDEFQEFARGEFSPENIECYKEADNIIELMFNETPDEDIQALLRDFFVNCIDSGAPLEVNVDGFTSVLLAELKEPVSEGHEMNPLYGSYRLGRLKRVLYELVKLDTWKRFTDGFRSQYTTVLKSMSKKKKFSFEKNKLHFDGDGQFFVTYQDFQNAWEKENKKHAAEDKKWTFRNFQEFFQMGIKIGLVDSESPEENPDPKTRKVTILNTTLGREVKKLLSKKRLKKFKKSQHSQPLKQLHDVEPTGTGTGKKT